MGKKLCIFVHGNNVLLHSSHCYANTVVFINFCQKQFDALYSKQALL